MSSENSAMAGRAGAPPGASSGGRAQVSDDGDLDAQIREAELAVIARDERVQRRFGEVRERLRRNSGVGLAGLAAGAGVMVATGLFTRRRRPGAVSAGALHASLLTYLVGLIRRAVPRSLHGVLPPGVSEILIGWGLPLLTQLISGRKPSACTDAGSAAGEAAGQARATVLTAAAVDLERYLGRWYEIARLPTPYEKHCVSDIVATYTLDPRQGHLTVLNQCRRGDGQVHSAKGVARVVKGSGNARLKVSFAPPLLRIPRRMWADYWILEVDPDYRMALVGTPDRRCLWLLSREPQMPPGDQERLLELARGQGYDIAALVHTDQRAPIGQA